jgi:dTDP-glucose 4,6-dehydratase
VARINTSGRIGYEHLKGNFMILVTGGAGFIGANFVLDWLNASDESVLNVDKLTYAGNLRRSSRSKDNPKHVFVRADICDRAALDALLSRA